MKKLIIFVGAPGSGKSSRGEECEKKGGYEYISTSRALQKLGYDLANAKSIPDFVTIDIIKDAIKNSKEEKIIVDGFTRLLRQAELLTKENIKIDQIVYFKINKSQARKRIMDRIICSECGRTYAENESTKSPKNKGLCDKCNAPLIKRNSDDLLIFDKRFSFFYRFTYPILQYFKEQGVKVKIVNAIDNFDITQII